MRFLVVAAIENILEKPSAPLRHDEKNILRDVLHDRYDKTALAKHAYETKHDIDWENGKILEYEIDFKSRQFIESYFINSASNPINDKKSVHFPQIYGNMFS